MRRVYPVVKRGADIMLSVIALILLSPVFILVFLAVRLDSPGPALFCQKRAGRNGTYFTIYKFRTMRMDAPSNMPTHLLKDSSRCITRVGSFLRKSSLDEIPQLINILLGQMSLIGPRPALWNQYDLIEARHACGVDAVRPGLTGWAQVHGRDELSIPQKVALDRYYVQHLGLSIDIRCLLMTVGVVSTAKGVVEGEQEKYAEEEARSMADGGKQ